MSLLSRCWLFAPDAVREILASRRCAASHAAGGAARARRTAAPAVFLFACRNIFA
jgi:hypothetical protein